MYLTIFFLSYGVVLCEMVTGEEPFPEINDLGELKKVVVDQKIRPKLNPKAPNCPPFLLSLIKVYLLFSFIYIVICSYLFI